LLPPGQPSVNGGATKPRSVETVQAREDGRGFTQRCPNHVRGFRVTRLAAESSQKFVFYDFATRRCYEPALTLWPPRGGEACCFAPVMLA
jgi:hypothetical protein